MTPVAISAVGMVSSLGIGSEEACAAARAGLARISPIDTLNSTIDPALAKETLDGVPPLVGHAAPAIAAGYCGLGKLIALARPALEEVLDKAGLSPAELSRTGMCLAVSDGFYQIRFGTGPEPQGEEPPPDYGTEWRGIAAKVATRLCDALDLRLDRVALPVFDLGRLGLLDALEYAARRLAEGAVDRCLIGTVESCLEPSALQAYGAARVLKTDANPVGFLPGEGAAFLLVEPLSRISVRTPALQVLALARATDGPYLDPSAQPLGRGIRDVVVRLASASVQAAPGIPSPWLADLNGTEFRAADWGNALVHLRERLGEAQPEIWLPVAYFGETGAATGGLGLCMAFEAASRGRLPSRTALLLLCAETGDRGGLLVATVGRY